MGDQLACAKCHRSLIEEAGCAICLPIKPHLLPMEVADEDSVPLAQLATETAGLLRAQLKQLKGLQRGAVFYDPILAEQSRQHANALAKLLDTARKVMHDGADAVDSMSFQEKAALFIEWFADLPPAYKRRVHDLISARMAESLHKLPKVEDITLESSSTN